MLSESQLGGAEAAACMTFRVLSSSALVIPGWLRRSCRKALGSTKEGAVTRKSFPRLPSKPPATLHPNIRQSFCKAADPAGARTTNLLSAAAGLLHGPRRNRRTHSTFDLIACPPFPLRQ